HGPAWFEPTEHGEPRDVPRVELGAEGAERERDIEGAADFETEERRRRHADDIDWPRNDGDGFADDVVAPAEMTLPQRVAQDRTGARAALPVVIRREQPATLGADSERPEAVAADPQQPHESPALAIAECSRTVGPREETVERLLSIAHLLEQRIGHVRRVTIDARIAVRILDPHARELSRIGDRQRAKANGVQQVKDRRIRADAERERKDGDDGECRTPAQHPQRVSEIDACGVGPSEASRLSQPFLPQDTKPAHHVTGAPLPCSAETVRKRGRLQSGGTRRAGVASVADDE